MRRNPVTHTFTRKAYLSDEAETPISVEYTYIPGYPPTGPSYESGGEPGTGPEVEIVRAWRLDGADESPLTVELSETDEDRIIADIAENHSDEWEDF